MNRLYKTINCIEKIGEGFEKAIGKQFITKKFPKPFNQIHIRRIWRKVNQIDIQFFCFLFHFFAMLICCIIYGAMVMHDINSLNEITRNAARYGSVIASGVEVNDKEKAVKDFIKNKAANGGLFLYEINTDPEVLADENSEVSMGVGADASTEKAIKVTASAQMKAGLPTFLFLDYFPDSMKTISSTITMRRED